MAAVSLLAITVAAAFITLWAGLGAIAVLIVTRRAMRLARQNPTGYGGYGLALSVLIVTMVSGSVLAGYAVSRFPRFLEKRKLRAEAATKATVFEIANLAEAYKSKTGSYPVSIEALRRFAGRTLPGDYWERQLTYQSYTEAIADARFGDFVESARPRSAGIPFSNFELRSAGPDGKFGTEDDIVMRDGVLHTSPEIVKRPPARAAERR
jgi:hypothetical protein